MIITKTVTVEQDIEINIFEELLKLDTQRIISMVIDLDRSIASWEHSIPMLISLLQRTLELSSELHADDRFVNDLYEVTKAMKKTLKKIIKENQND